MNSTNPVGAAIPLLRLAGPERPEAARPHARAPEDADRASPPADQAWVIALLHALQREVAALHRRIDTLDRHGGDIIFLLLSLPELLSGKRRDFSERSRTLLCRAVAAPPYEGRCPCCRDTPVLAASGQPLPGAEFDHVFHGSLNRPEHGWLVCSPCHHVLTHDGYLARLARMDAFRAFQATVVPKPGPGGPPRRNRRP